MSVVTLTKNVELTVEECITCGVVHAIPTELRTRYHKHGGFWVCPNGHSQGWNKKNSTSEAEKREAEIARLSSQIAYKDEQIASERRRVSAAKGEVTKIKKRVGNGVCPCCNRSFQNLHRHISNQHPEFVQEG